MAKVDTTFISFFPNTKYRYLDLTGNGRQAVSSVVVRNDLNKDGFDSFFTVNGFANADDNKKDQCTNLNAFFCDIDKKLTEEEINKIKAKLEPTFIIETMHGTHWYWCLDEVVYKDEVENWNDIVAKWEGIEQSIIHHIKDADPVVKDVTRILRVPGTQYWKKTDGSTKIKGVHKAVACVYSFEQVAEAFPPLAISEDGIDYSPIPTSDTQKKYAEAEKKDFFDKVNQKYQVENRPSFKALISGEEGTLPPNVNSRNHALLITASLMRQAGWSQKKATDHIKEVGWHGIEKETGGMNEITATINSAYRTPYTFSYKNEIIAHNMTSEESQAIQNAYTAVMKDRREVDKVRFSNYEHEILVKSPFLKKNEVGIIFNYDNGVYSMMSDQDISSLVLNSLYEDMLWGYRTKKSVADKVACLLSIIPDLVLTDDNGYIFNVKNGLLNIVTKELKKHTPNYVSLIQSSTIYDPEAQCPTWDQCMLNWMEGEESEKKTRLLQQFCGYTLSSSMKKSTALFLIGDGGNGKSTFADTVAMVIGDKGVSHIDLDALYGQFGMKGLIGKRLNIVEEVAGNYYESNKLKHLISGEEITIDMKYKDQFKFRPQAKFIFAVNQMPRVDDTSTATERRIAAVQFLNNFRDRPNTELRFTNGKLYNELPGILNWMLKGVDMLREDEKFVVTQEQLNLLAEYRQENSSVEGFIAECIEFQEGLVSPAKDIYEAYVNYCKRDGRKSKSNMAFSKEMKAYGYRNRKFTFIARTNGHDGNRFEGIKINDEWATTVNAYAGF